MSLLKDAINALLKVELHTGTQGVCSHYYAAQTDQMLHGGMKEQA